MDVTRSQPSSRAEYEQLERELALLRSLGTTAPLVAISGSDGQEYWIDLEVGLADAQATPNRSVAPRFEELGEW